ARNDPGHTPPRRRSASLAGIERIEFSVRLGARNGRADAIRSGALRFAVLTRAFLSCIAHLIANVAGYFACLLASLLAPFLCLLFAVINAFVHGIGDVVTRFFSASWCEHHAQSRSHSSADQQHK